MTGAKSIEALGVVFTAGILAGTAVSAGAAGILAAGLLPLLTLPILLRERLRRMADGPAVSIVLLSFLLLGFFCAVLRSLPVMESPSAIRIFAMNAADALRARIDAFPFRPEGTAPLLKAFLTADRSGLPAQTVGLFRASGASHLLALSGLHMGIIYLLFDKLTEPVMGTSRPARHHPLCALRPGRRLLHAHDRGRPFHRAGLSVHPDQGTAAAAASARQKQPGALPGPFGAAGTGPFRNSQRWLPAVLLSHGGHFHPLSRIGSLVSSGARWNPLRRIWNGAALAVSCQLFTAPLSWHYFHSFPRHFLLTNLLAIPLTTGLLSSAVTMLLLDALHLCPSFLISLVDKLCSLLLWVLEVIATM